jgi:metal-dependent amidase/aminoacylase/carboxypeptidase family protein
MERRMNEVCSGVGATYGAKVLLNYKRCYPATVNTDVDAVDRVCVSKKERLVGTG